MSAELSSPVVDVRTVVPRERHALIFSTFDGLLPGERMELVNDHDPMPLRSRFDRELAGQYGWDYLEQGPAVWRVAISRKAATHGHGTCCGSCGG
jgi:uncharacterized protein (DUF2249 family)